MKKKDQESLRKIVIIGLVVVVGYLGSQSMTSDSSPIGEAAPPNSCLTVGKTAVGNITAVAFRTVSGRTRQELAAAVGRMEPVVCKDAKAKAKIACESINTNPIRKPLEEKTLRICEEGGGSCELIRHVGKLSINQDSKSTGCRYRSSSPESHFSFLGPKGYTSKVYASATLKCDYWATYQLCGRWVTPSVEATPILDPDSDPVERRMGERRMDDVWYP